MVHTQTIASLKRELPLLMDPPDLSLSSDVPLRVEPATATPNLREFDIILINTSGGKDSQCMLDMVCQQARRDGVLDRVHAVHAILEEEWPGTPELVRRQCDAYGVPLHLVKRPESLLDYVRRRRRWPSSHTRWCTSDFKRAPIATVITALARAHPHPQPNILNCLGFRRAESPARAKRAPLMFDAKHSSRNRKITIWLPIFEFTLDDVWETIRRSGVPHHRAYDLGMPRLSCCYCIFAPRNALLLAGHHNKTLLHRYVQVEQEIGHRFRVDLSLTDIQRAVEQGETPGAITTWEM